MCIEDAPGEGRSGVVTGKRSGVLWGVLTAVYARLGFDALGNEAFAQLVLARATASHGRDRRPRAPRRRPLQRHREIHPRAYQFSDVPRGHESGDHEGRLGRA